MQLFPHTDPNRPIKGDLADSLLLKLIFLLMSILLCSLLGTLLIQLFSTVIGMDFSTTLASLQPESSLKERNFIRWAHLISQLFTFTVPALLLGWFFFRRHIWQQFRLSPLPSLPILALGIALIVFSFPLTQVVYWFNQQVPLPAWADQLEDQANEAIQALLVMDSPWILIFNLVVIALLPAIGEELIFRGLLQQQVEQRFGRPIAAIWLAAFVFSAFHLQFAGFLPRLLLGAILGYLFYWTRSLWIPIAAHFVFNGAQILGQYLLGEEFVKTETDRDFNPNWVAAILSLVLVIGLIRILKKRVALEQKPPV